MRFNPWPGAGGEYLTPDEKRSALDSRNSWKGSKYYVDLFAKHKVVPPRGDRTGAQEVRTRRP
jgi:hypothetical protein